MTNPIRFPGFFHRIVTPTAAAVPPSNVMAPMNSTNSYSPMPIVFAASIATARPTDGIAIARPTTPSRMVRCADTAGLIGCAAATGSPRTARRRGRSSPQARWPGSGPACDPRSLPSRIRREVPDVDARLRDGSAVSSAHDGSLTVRTTLRDAPALQYRYEVSRRTPALSIRLLGPLEVAVSGVPVVVDTRKALAIVALLAAEGRPFARDELAAMFWPEADDEAARGALRRTLSALRTAGRGSGLVIGRSQVAHQRAVVGDASQRQDGGQARHARRCGSARNGRQVPISAGVGLFCGGTQRTALVIMQSTSVRPSSGRARVAAAGEAETRAASRRAGRRQNRR